MHSNSPAFKKTTVQAILQCMYTLSHTPDGSRLIEVSWQNAVCSSECALAALVSSGVDLLASCHAYMAYRWLHEHC